MMLLQLRIRNEMIRVMGVVIFYSKKLRVMVWRAARCLRPCDRLMSPVSLILSHLRIRNETSNRCCYSLLKEVKSDGVKSYKMSEALR